MFDFYGPVNGTGPISVTNQVPDEQINRLIQALERNTAGMAKLTNEIADLEKEVGELDTTVAGTELVMERIATAIESNIADESKLRQLVANIRGNKEKVAAANARGTAAAEELEKEDGTDTPTSPE